MSLISFIGSKLSDRCDSVAGRHMNPNITPGQSLCSRSPESRLYFILFPKLVYFGIGKIPRNIHRHRVIFGFMGVFSKSFYWFSNLYFEFIPLWNLVQVSCSHDIIILNFSCFRMMLKSCRREYKKLYKFKKSDCIRKIKTFFFFRYINH